MEELAATSDAKVSTPGLNEEVVPHGRHLLRQSMRQLFGRSGERTPHSGRRGW